jgi:hypothetical protein
LYYSNDRVFCGINMLTSKLCFPHHHHDVNLMEKLMFT